MRRSHCVQLLRVLLLGTAAGLAQAASIQFTVVPTFVPSADGRHVSIVAPDVRSDCDPAGGCNVAPTFGAASVQLWATDTPYPPPGDSHPLVPAHGVRTLAFTSLGSYDAATGSSAADPAPVAYTGPGEPGTYYLTLAIIGSQGPISNVIVYDAYTFPGPVAVGDTAPPTPPSPVVPVVEYYNAAMNHYFLTTLPGEIALCNAGTPPCAGWQTTGHGFNAFEAANAPAWATGVCRFFNASFAPLSSHFYALHGDGCEDTLALFPDWLLESSNAFATAVPAADGRCGDGYAPVYRLYNNGQGGAPNHRFVTGMDQRAQMLAAGWVPEGAGTLGVAFCVPQ